MIKRLQNLNTGVVLLVNIFVMLAFMKYNSSVCEGSFSGGESVKQKDNSLFFIQVVANIAFVAFYLIVVNKRKWLILMLSLVLTTFFYLVAATLHSFLQG